MHQILTNRGYTGQASVYRYTKEGRKSAIPRPEEEHIRLPEGVVPQIIDLETFEAVQEQLARNKECSLRNHKHPNDTGILRAGFARCGICGHVMHVRHHVKAYSGRSTPNKAEYFCIVNTGVDDLLHHHSVSILLDILDEEAWKLAVHYIKHPHLVKQQVEKLRKAYQPTTNRDDIEETLATIRRQMSNLYKLAKAAADDETVDQLTGMMKDLERQKRQAEAMIYEVEEEEEVRQKIQADIDKFEDWANCVRPLLGDPTYQPTYQEKRLAIQILGIAATVYPTESPKRLKIEVGPPSIMSLISVNRLLSS